MLKSKRNILIVGIKGAAMSNMAVMLSQLGHTVTGCDVAEEFITDEILKEYSIPVIVGFEKSNVTQFIDLVVYSAAHNGRENPLVVEAEHRNISVMSQAELLSLIFDSFPIKLAVCGCHGKTTTSSLLTFALKQLGSAPSYMIGAPRFNKFAGGAIDGAKYMVVEADEYGVDPPRDKTPKLLFLHPTHTLCTNIDFDHPDVYSSIDDTKKAFTTFFKGGNIYACADDKPLVSVVSKYPQKTKTFGFSKTADLSIVSYSSTPDATEFNLRYITKPLGTFTIPLFGTKNVSNVTGVILLLMDLGFEIDAIRKAISGFTGVKRRLELAYQNKGTYLFDDYGHHPAEIAATIGALRNRFPTKRILVLFQPHTYSRTEILKKEFAQSLTTADYALVVPIFASAREKHHASNVSAHDIQKEAFKLGKRNVTGFNTLQETLTKLENILIKNDVVLTIGAGDIYKLKDDIIKIIQRVDL